MDPIICEITDATTHDEKCSVHNQIEELLLWGTLITILAILHNLDWNLESYFRNSILVKCHFITQYTQSSLGKKEKETKKTFTC